MKWNEKTETNLLINYHNSTEAIITKCITKYEMNIKYPIIFVHTLVLPISTQSPILE